MGSRPFEVRASGLGRRGRMYDGAGLSYVADARANGRTWVVQGFSTQQQLAGGGGDWTRTPFSHCVV